MGGARERPLVCILLKVCCTHSAVFGKRKEGVARKKGGLFPSHLAAAAAAAPMASPPGQRFIDLRIDISHKNEILKYIDKGMLV